MISTARILPAVCILVFLTFCETLPADSKLSYFKSDEDKLTLKPGEKLVYSVRWMRMPVGTAVTHVKEITEVDGRLVYNITTRTRANRFIRLLYNVDDRISSQVEVDGFRPLRYQKRLREGRKKKDELITFNWETKKATYYKGKGANRKKRRDIPITEGTQDPLSGLFFLRGLPLELGRECVMTVATERKSWNVVIKPIERTTMNLRGIGKFDVLVIEPIVEFEGLFVHKSKLKIWLDEETKIPLKIVADIPIGSITIILREVYNTEAEEKEPGPVVKTPAPWETSDKDMGQLDTSPAQRHR